MVVDFKFPLFGLERASSSGMNTSRRAALFLGYNQPQNYRWGGMGMGGHRDAIRILPLFLLFFIFLYLFIYFFLFFLLFSSPQARVSNIQSTVSFSFPK